MKETENKTVSNNRERAYERMRNKYPDKNFDDDEAFFGQINDDYDDYDKQIGGYKEREKVFSDMFDSDPRSATFLANWKKGSDPAIELVRQFGTEIKDAIDDPERQDAIAEANKKYVERVAKEKELNEEYEKNLAESLQYLDTFQEENGLTDKEVDDTMQILINIVKDGILGKFSPESIQMARKAITHDIDVEDAALEGEVRGKNAKIEEKLRNRKQGDGMARLDGRNGSGINRPKRDLGVLDKFGDNNLNIWERGGERRIKRNND